MLDIIKCFLYSVLMLIITPFAFISLFMFLVILFIIELLNKCLPKDYRFK